MKQKASICDQPTKASERWCAVAEVGLIFLVFFLFAGSPVPDRNEAHYLAKAKHYWNPDWCPRDPFLESGDAHLVFYWTLGLPTLYMSLPAVAWSGRLLTWALLAWSWRRLSYSLVPKRLFAVLSAAVFLALIEHGHLAGEWIVGGLEAKGFAYVLVFLGLDALVRDRWRAVWLLFGAAAAFHVLVGGWAVIAAGVAWLLRGSSRPSLLAMLPALIAGFVLSLPGLLPAVALTRGVDAETVSLANYVYVFQRLPHHLVFHRFSHWFMFRHAMLIVTWLLISRAVRSDEKQRRLFGFVAGALAIGVAGAILDQATLWQRELAASLLRFYWFRLSDAMLPLGTALACGGLLLKYDADRPRFSQWLLCTMLLIATVNLGDILYRRNQDFRPPAEIQSRPATLTSPQQERELYEDWVRACRWIAMNTKPDDLFLTPRTQQTFKWYAGRAEVCTVKDVPQDAAALLQWWVRLHEVYQRGMAIEGVANLGEAHLMKVSHQHGAKYIVVDRAASNRPLKFVRVYPNVNEANRSFEVYLVPDPPTVR